MPSYKLRKSNTGPKNYYAFWSEGRRSKSVSTRTKDKTEAIEFAETYFKELYAEKDAPPAEVLLASARPARKPMRRRSIACSASTARKPWRQT